MIGKKRPSISQRSNNTTNNNNNYYVEQSSIPVSVKSLKSTSFSGKENVPPSSITCNRVEEFSDPINQTQGGSCPLLNIQDDRILTCDDSSSNTSHWVADSCFSSSLDDLDLEILGNSSYICTTTCQVRSSDGCDDCSLDRVYAKFHSIESRLLLSSSSRLGKGGERVQDIGGNYDVDEEDFEPHTQFDMLMRWCSEEDDASPHDQDVALACPLCGIDISQWDGESRLHHANDCLDKSVAPKEVSCKPSVQYSEPPVAEDPVIKWLHDLGLAKYEAGFVEQEIDWESLKWLTEEDLIAIGVNALGPRKKMLQSLKQLRTEDNIAEEQGNDDSGNAVDVTKKPAMNKLITEYFSSPSGLKKKLASSGQPTKTAKSNPCQRLTSAKTAPKGKNKDVPLWCTIPGTPFQVDAFRYLRRDCSHWFLTHFHIDHYQGLTKSFSYGKIYCSMITAKLLTIKIGIPWETLNVMPLNQKINVAGVDVTCYDANHCPGAIIILFEPPNGKAVLHTGDFRFNEEMAKITSQLECHINTLILDTTYCNPQYNFPKKEAVVQFVIESIQAESFNSKTLFLIGSYTIGKERIFLEVARVLRKKIYVPVAKLRLLECLELPTEDMQWFTLNEHESNIHIVPMWTIASFKRLKHVSCQYAEKFSLVVAFSPTGWSFGKGKKTAGRSGRRYQQGTIIRYEVPYSEHCSFEELREFVQLISPDKIIPSVNNESEASSNAMIELLS